MWLRTRGLRQKSVHAVTSVQLYYPLDRCTPGPLSMGVSRPEHWSGLCRRCKTCRFDPWVGKIPWRRAWLPPPVFLPGDSRGQRSLVGHSPCGQEELVSIE